MITVCQSLARPGSCGGQKIWADYKRDGLNYCFQNKWGLTVQFLELNGQTAYTNDLITAVKSCAELATLFGRTKCIELAHMVCCKIFK